MKFLLICLTLSACTLSWNAWDVGRRPVAAPGSDPTWVYRVDSVADIWSARLFASGCAIRPFDGSAGTGPVYLLPEAEYDSFDDAPGSDGLTWSYRININEEAGYGTGALAHEMGHALGLEHISIEEDPLSVMHPILDSVVEPDARDVEAVMDRLGCR